MKSRFNSKWRVLKGIEKLGVMPKVILKNLCFEKKGTNDWKNCSFVHKLKWLLIIGFISIWGMKKREIVSLKNCNFIRRSEDVEQSVEKNHRSFCNLIHDSLISRIRGKYNDFANTHVKEIDIFTGSSCGFYLWCWKLSWKGRVIIYILRTITYRSVM